MVHITYADGFVFFGSIVLGAIIGIVGSFFVESVYRVFDKHLRPLQGLVFVLSLIVVVVLIVGSLFWFSILSTAEDPVSENINSPIIVQNITYVSNNYTYFFGQEQTIKSNYPITAEELKGLLKKKSGAMWLHCLNF